MKTRVHKRPYPWLSIASLIIAKLETAHTSIDSWTDIEIMVYEHDGVWSSIKKKKQTTNTHKHGWISKTLYWTQQKKTKWVYSGWLHLKKGINVAFHWGYGLESGKRGLYRMIEMFYILIWMMITRVYGLSIFIKIAFFFFFWFF